MTKVCWRCNKIDGSNYCSACGARIRDTRTPYEPTAHDVEFIRDVYSFGWYTRRVTALALYEQILKPDRLYDSGRPTEFQPVVEVGRCQWILRAKIFSEFVSMLEVFGLLCLAIRNRKKRSVIWTAMNAEPQEVMQFYKNLKTSQARSLSRLLNFPSMSKVTKAVEKQTGGAERINITDATYEGALANMLNVAEMYLGLDSVMVRAYNKIKHTFPLLDTPYWTKNRKDNELGVLVEDEKIPSGQFAAFPLKINQEDVDQEIKYIARVTEIGAEIMAIYLQLHELSMLGT